VHFVSAAQQVVPPAYGVLIGHVAVQTETEPPVATSAPGPEGADLLGHVAPDMIVLLVPS